jgi:nucleotide-binding universal stress UspA family protein
MYSHILVALDGSELAERVLPHVEALAEKFGSTLTLLRATPMHTLAVAPSPIGLPMSPPPSASTMEALDEAIEYEHQAAGEYLRKLAETLKARGLQVNLETVNDHPAHAIIGRASALGADLIAMTTHGHTGLERLFLGSTAEEVVRKAPCAVLLVRVHEPPQEG